MAEEQIVLSPDEYAKSKLGKQVYFYIDKQNSFSIEDISKKEFQDNFTLSKSENPQFGYTPHTIWLKINLKETNQIQRDWLLEIAYSGLDLIEFYSQIKSASP